MFAGGAPAQGTLIVGAPDASSSGVAEEGEQLQAQESCILHLASCILIHRLTILQRAAANLASARKGSTVGRVQDIASSHTFLH